MELKNYKKPTRLYIKNVIEYINSKYGSVPPEWWCIIQLLADNLELYNCCKKSIQENGIYDVTTGRKNPLLSTVKDLQATIIKQIQHLGLSPYAVSKIHDTTEDNTDEFIESLTNGE